MLFLTELNVARIIHVILRAGINYSEVHLDLVKGIALRLIKVNDLRSSWNDKTVANNFAVVKCLDEAMVIGSTDCFDGHSALVAWLLLIFHEGYVLIEKSLRLLLLKLKRFNRVS